MAASPREWSLRDILVEVFNYCFPVDFRQRMRLHLKRVMQGSRPVHEFVHELQELFLMVGYLTEESRVEQLWYGLKPALQSELWRAPLNLSTASWSEVQAEAEIAELALAASATADRGQRGGSGHRDSGGRGPSDGAGSSHNAPPNASAPAARAQANRRERRDARRGPHRTAPSSTPTEARATPLRENVPVQNCPPKKWMNCALREVLHLQGNGSHVTELPDTSQLDDEEPLQVLSASTARMEELQLHSLELAGSAEMESAGFGHLVLPALP
ncbi:hypothetical protein BV20DRAFT_1052472 [Pilatotrama ljubarskyi]|nr:hypothetical protein BV20DRAFT_1052472 [Pilatotrama ljubarskyi]